MYISKFIAISMATIIPIFSVYGSNSEYHEDKGNIRPFTNTQAISDAPTSSDINGTHKEYDSSYPNLDYEQKEQAIELFKKAVQKGEEEARVARTNLGSLANREWDDTREKRTALAPLMGDRKVRNISFHILSYLTQDGINRLANVQKSSHQLVKNFRKAKLNSYILAVNNPDMSEAQVELGHMSHQDQDYLRDALINRLRGITLCDENVEAPGFVFVARGSGLNGICLRPLQRITNLTGLISDDQLTTICAKLFAPGQKPGVTIETIANYLPFHLYTQEGQVFNADEFMKKIEALENFKPLVHFGADNMDEEFLRQNPCEIIIDDTDLQSNPGKLQDILNDNPNHTITLNLGDKFVNEDGQIKLSSQHLPNKIRHLRLIDIKRKIVSIGDYFLGACKDLTSFDSSGLTHLTQIGHGFLYRCPDLTSFDSSGLTNVTKIGNLFLALCTSLKSFDSSGLTHLTQIGEYFLYGCESLKSFDSSGLTNVTKIGNRLLLRCKGLRSFNSSGLTNVKEIGNDFLYECTGLTSFDSSGLTHLTQIGSYFLYGCESLKSFDSSGLTHVTQIGKYFLEGCTGINKSTKDNFLRDFTYYKTGRKFIKDINKG